MLERTFSLIKDKIRSKHGLDIGFVRRTLMVYVVIFVLWGLYRLLLRFPVFIEELVFKPVIFLLPVLSMLASEGKEDVAVFEVLGFRRSRLLLSLYFGLTLGIAYVLAVKLGSYVFSQSILFEFSWVTLTGYWSVLLISLATAVWEQTVFSGFFLLRFQRAFRNEWQSVGLTAFLFIFLHLPILLIDSEARLIIIFIQLLLLFLVGFGNAVLMLRTRNILAPILSHTFWSLGLGLLP